MSTPSRKPLVVFADDDPMFLKVMNFRLQGRYRVVAVQDKGGLYQQLAKEEPAALFLDLEFGEHDGIEILQELVRQRPRMPIILFTGHGSIDSAVSAIKLGAFDYLTKPGDLVRLQVVLDHALERHALTQRVDRLEHLAAEKKGGRLLWGDSPAMVRLRDMIAQVAATDAAVLIEGESGTGKELVASLLHAESPRCRGPLIPVNMAALPRELVESTLFGHEKGAFTGAERLQIGSCEAAHQGTLFLDEIGEMDLGVQAKLLRFLQEHTVQRVGSSTPQTVDVRVVAATNRDLRKRVEAGAFREDLFYRLHVVPVQVPPLRDRAEDIMLLARQFLQRAGERYRKSFLGFSESASRALAAYHWPGNVRQLENLIERLAVLHRGPTIEVDDLPAEVLQARPEMGAKSAHLSTTEPSLRPMDQLEKDAIVAALKQTGGNVREAATRLGLGLATVYRKIKTYQISVPGRENMRPSDPAP